MRNIQLIIAYKGTCYAGWQRQNNAVTVEETITNAIESITREKIVLYGSGRTDAGVHAIGQSANFYTMSQIPEERFAFAINTKLPLDIRIQKSMEKTEEFHSRYSAKGKTYTYQMYIDRISSPFYNDLSWHINQALDIDKMKAAADLFIGTHDFRGFMASGSSVKNTVRTIETIIFKQKGFLLSITYKGTGFLYNMVRIITGTLYEVGLGKIAVKDIPAIIASCERHKAGITAPAKGLFLETVLYE